MTAEIIPFSVTRRARARKPRRSKSMPEERAAKRPAAASVLSVDFPETGRQRAGRSRNPLRQHLRKIEWAMVIAGKLHRNEPLGAYDDITWLREGADAARVLAEQLALVAERSKHAP